MEEKKNAYKIYVVKAKRKRRLGRHERRWEYNIKTDLKEIRWEDVDWKDVAEDRDR
jgi:hypothetical protein